MKIKAKFNKFLAALLLPLVSLASDADQRIFSATDIYSSTGPGAHQSLRFDDIVDVQITNDTQQPSIIESLKIDFANANSLSIHGLQQVGPDEYIGKVNNAWIYKSILVKVNVHSNHGQLSSGSRLFVQASIMDSESNINSLSSSGNSNPDFELFILDGEVVDVTPKILADTVELEYQGKPLTINVFRDLKLDSQSPNAIIDVNINWLGHGEKDTQTMAHIPALEYQDFSVKSVKIREDEYNQEKLVEFTLENKNDAYLKIFSEVRLEELLIGANLM